MRHKEIIDVLARGTRVLGASGMGALRAAELWHYGMEGVGVVFGMYAQGDLEADDEVAVAPVSSGDLRQSSLPLVSLRWTIANAVTARVLRAAEGEALLEAARTLHHTERTWAALGRATRQTRPAPAVAVRALREFARRRPELSDLKRRDALAALSRSLEDPPGSA
ncbi:TfuA-like protein [Streptomyces sp. S1A(2023)]